MFPWDHKLCISMLISILTSMLTSMLISMLISMCVVHLRVISMYNYQYLLTSMLISMLMHWRLFGSWRHWPSDTANPSTAPPPSFGSVNSPILGRFISEPTRFMLKHLTFWTKSSWFIALIARFMAPIFSQLEDPQIIPKPPSPLIWFP